MFVVLPHGIQWHTFLGVYNMSVDNMIMQVVRHQLLMQFIWTNIIESPNRNEIVIIYMYIGWCNIQNVTCLLILDYKISNNDYAIYYNILTTNIKVNGIIIVLKLFHNYYKFSLPTKNPSMLQSHLSVLRSGCYDAASRWVLMPAETDLVCPNVICVSEMCPERRVCL